MKLFSKFLAAGIVLAASTFAHAATLSGNIFMSSSNNGTFTDTFSSTGITFNPTGTGAEQTTSGTGDFSGIKFGDSVNLTNIVFSNFNGNGGQQIFQFVDAGSTYTFNGSTYVLVGSTYTFTGTLYLNGSAVNTNSVFRLTNSSGGAVNPDTFSTSNVNPALGATPEPNSLVLLGTGLVSAAGVVMRKRRTV